METKIYSTSEKFGSQLCYQLLVFDEWDSHTCTDVYTWIGEDDEDIFSLALNKMLEIIKDISGIQITDEIRSKYEKMYDNEERISVKGLHFVIKCELPEFVEKV